MHTENIILGSREYQTRLCWNLSSYWQRRRLWMWRAAESITWWRQNPGYPPSA